jgi:hypothetical protein
LNPTHEIPWSISDFFPLRGRVLRAGPPGPLCFLFFVFSHPPTTSNAQGRPLTERSKTLGPADTSFSGGCHIVHVLHLGFGLRLRGHGWRRRGTGGGCASSPHSLGNRSRGGNRGGGSGSCRVPAGSSPVCPRADSAAGEDALPKPWNGWLWRSCLSRLRLLARLLRALPPNTHSALEGAPPVRLRCTYSALAVCLLCACHALTKMCNLR